ncbi:LysR family transcriptional regulator [Pelagibacterium montanilacus]|uniref:LysR family transcriptional regulator n=1 Tax=Pelagibacterium montanilacus TaxID=2185280 RepID=UPI000F8CD91F|nr:LysR family transcriptional regulator [Pelagibacterium montanilacus]
MQCSLRDISIFVAAYEERSFTGAAQRENATQSGVSQHMRNLEYMLGVQLFLREHGGVTPTPAAASFYRKCLDVLRAHAIARADVARFAETQAGEVRIGLMPTMTSRALSPSLDAFVRQAPNTIVRITEGYSARLTQLVQSGELDCAIVPALAAVPGVRSRFFVRTPETLVSRAGTGLTHLDPVRLADHGPLRIVLPDVANTRRQTIEAYCAERQIEIAQIVELDSMLGTLDFVSRSDWVTVLPAIMMPEDAGEKRLCVNPIVSPELDLDLVMIEPIRKPMSPHTERFLGYLETEALRLSASWEKIRQRKPRPESSVRLVAQA